MDVMNGLRNARGADENDLMDPKALLEDTSSAKHHLKREQSRLPT
jgi:hypothetical protein